MTNFLMKITVAEIGGISMDVCGASLNGQKVSNLKIPELKCWLQCRRAPTVRKLTLLQG